VEAPPEVPVGGVEQAHGATLGRLLVGATSGLSTSLLG
jgi:hypothetical protein